MTLGAHYSLIEHVLKVGKEGRTMSNCKVHDRLSESDSMKLGFMSGTGICPIPYNESRRLEVVRELNLMDSRNSTDNCERLVQLLSRIFKVANAEVTLIDVDTQVIVASSVMSSNSGSISCGNVAGTIVNTNSTVHAKSTAVSRASSLCSYVIMEREESLVLAADTLADNRFATHPQVLGGSLFRFYAAVPLVVRGVKVGTICLHDFEAHDDKPQMLQKIRTMLPEFGALLSERLQHRLDQARTQDVERARVQMGIAYSLKLPLEGCKAATTTADGSASELKSAYTAIKARQESTATLVDVEEEDDDDDGDEDMQLQRQEFDIGSDDDDDDDDMDRYLAPQPNRRHRTGGRGRLTSANLAANNIDRRNVQRTSPQQQVAQKESMIDVVSHIRLRSMCQRSEKSIKALHRSIQMLIEAVESSLFIMHRVVNVTNQGNRTTNVSTTTTTTADSSSSSSSIDETSVIRGILATTSVKTTARRQLSSRAPPPLVANNSNNSLLERLENEDQEDSTTEADYRKLEHSSSLLLSNGPRQQASLRSPRNPAAAAAAVSDPKLFTLESFVGDMRQLLTSQPMTAGKIIWQLPAEAGAANSSYINDHGVLAGRLIDTHLHAAINATGASQQSTVAAEVAIANSKYPAPTMLLERYATHPNVLEYLVSVGAYRYAARYNRVVISLRFKSSRRGSSSETGAYSSTAATTPSSAAAGGHVYQTPPTRGAIVVNFQCSQPIDESISNNNSNNNSNRLCDDSSVTSTLTSKTGRGSSYRNEPRPSRSVRKGTSVGALSHQSSLSLGSARTVDENGASCYDPVSEDVFEEVILGGLTCFVAGLQCSISRKQQQQQQSEGKQEEHSISMGSAGNSISYNSYPSSSKAQQGQSSSAFSATAATATGGGDGGEEEVVYEARVKIPCIRLPSNGPAPSPCSIARSLDAMGVNASASNTPATTPRARSNPAGNKSRRSHRLQQQQQQQQTAADSAVDMSNYREQLDQLLLNQANKLSSNSNAAPNSHILTNWDRCQLRIDTHTGGGAGGVTGEGGTGGGSSSTPSPSMWGRFNRVAQDPTVGEEAAVATRPASAASRQDQLVVQSDPHRGSSTTNGIVAALGAFPRMLLSQVSNAVRFNYRR